MRTIFLFGPTAVGKTSLLCDCFAKGFEVVNADSIQVYKELNIGSAKADEKTRALVSHHLIDIREPWETFNVADFISLADKACEEIRSRGNIPVICGGTAYYFKHFLYGLSEAPASNNKTRNEVASFIEKVGNLEAHKFLASVDPVSAARINVNDTYRISRAIEVFKDSGKPLSSFELPKEPRNKMDVVCIGLCRDKESLVSRIRLRVDLMFEQGMVEEMKYLFSIGANSNWQSMQAIGYREFMELDMNNLDIPSVKESIIMNSIHYAKRQMTFFKSFADVNWVDPEDSKVVKALL